MIQMIYEHVLRSDFEVILFFGFRSLSDPQVVILLLFVWCYMSKYFIISRYFYLLKNYMCYCIYLEFL